MVNQAMRISQRFNDSEHLWFWFCSAKKIRVGFKRSDNASDGRICELMDVEVLITKLYLSGRLNDAQLMVMKEFGERRRVPNPNIFSEKEKSILWNDAMRQIQMAAYDKGWI